MILSLFSVLIFSLLFGLQFPLVSPAQWEVMPPDIKCSCATRSSATWNLSFMNLSCLNNGLEFTDDAMPLFSKIFGMYNINGLTGDFSMDADLSNQNNSHFLSKCPSLILPRFHLFPLPIEEPKNFFSESWNKDLNNFWYFGSSPADLKARNSLALPYRSLLLSSPFSEPFQQKSCSVSEWIVKMMTLTF